jgi:hypothetical protein
MAVISVMPSQAVADPKSDRPAVGTLAACALHCTKDYGAARAIGVKSQRKTDKFVQFSGDTFDGDEHVR